MAILGKKGAPGARLSASAVPGRCVEKSYKGKNYFSISELGILFIVIVYFAGESPRVSGSGAPRWKTQREEGRSTNKENRTSPEKDITVSIHLFRRLKNHAEK